ncbi:recombinase family protein [Candidatus Peribacteria bacterium]|nr:recombinase family protein [Candidatus Peribacteria bacterium]
MGEMMEGWLALNARFENRVRVDRTIGAEKRLTAQGYWCRPAPTGFINGKVMVDGKRRPVLLRTPDEKQWSLLQSGLQKQLTGAYTLSDTAKWLRSEGFVSRNGKPISVQTWEKICRNPVYGGLLQEKWTDGKLIKAKFEGALTPVQWQELQTVLDDRGRKQTVPKRVQKHRSFPLRRFLRCSGCGGLCRGYPSIGKSGKRYFYYDCPSPQCKFRVPTEETHTLYKEKLQDMTPSGGVLNLFRAIVEEAWEKKIESFQRSSGDTKEQQSILIKEQADIVQLLKQCADNPALVAQLKSDYQTTEQKIEALKNPKEKPAFLKYDKTEVLDRCCNYLKTADELWGKSPVEAQYRFQYMTFPDGISYDCLQDKRTPKVSLVYAALGEIQNGDSSLAASRGIEPLLPG